MTIYIVKGSLIVMNQLINIIQLCSSPGSQEPFSAFQLIVLVSHSATSLFWFTLTALIASFSSISSQLFAAT